MNINVTLIILTLIIGTIPVLALPQMVDPNRFQIELYADLTELGGFPRAFQMTLTEGENGFPSGLYLTSGPVSGTGSDRLFHIDDEGKVRVVKDGFNSTQTMIFARDRYGDGMLITEPRELRIARLLADGTVATFAELGTTPFGPSILTYDPTGNLYVTDAASGNILRVKSDGSSEIFASLPLSGKAPIESGSNITFDTSGRYGGGFIAAIFTGGAEPTDVGSIYLVSADGRSVKQLVNGLNGIELMTFGPGGAFGSDLFVASQETDMPGDGAVYTMTPDGTLSPFINGIDATHVVFDTQNILGGGMFVAELPNVCAMCEGGPKLAAGKVWRVIRTDATPAAMKVEFEHNTFDVTASLSNGNIRSIDVDPDFSSIILIVETSNSQDGSLDITLPRKLIDARTDGQDDEFVVLVDGEESLVTEKDATADSRVLSLSIPAGTEEIEIIGTEVIPEFSVVALFALAASVAVMLFIGNKKRLMKPHSGYT